MIRACVSCASPPTLSRRTTPWPTAALRRARRTAMANDLTALLRSLGLLAAADGLSDLIAFATKNRASPAQLLEHLADLEEKDRARRSLERRTSRSRIGR